MAGWSLQRIFTEECISNLERMKKGMMATQKSERKLYLVTGANAGIGDEIARGLARAEGRPGVILACRDAAKGEAARKKLAAETGNPHLEVLVMDLASEASIRKAVE